MLIEYFIIYDANDHSWISNEDEKYFRCEHRKDAYRFTNKQQAYDYIDQELPVGVYQIYPLTLKKE